MSAVPYIGITGPTTPVEADFVTQKLLNGCTLAENHLRMVGVLASERTLLGEHTENRRYPAIETLPYIFEAIEIDDRMLPMVHYNTKNIDTLDTQLLKLFEPLESCHSVQLNVPWPAKEHIDTLKTKYSNMLVVFQANSVVLNSDTTEKVAERIGAYGTLIDYVLLDPSGGTGKTFDINRSVAFAKEIKKTSDATIGFAGGLDGKTVTQVVSELVSRLQSKNFCVDAEGGLRTKLSDKYGDDFLDVHKVDSYASNAGKGYSLSGFIGRK